MKKFLTLGFLPKSPDAALLVLRLVFGLSLLLLHGWDKLMKFPDLKGSFWDPLGVGHLPSLFLALLGEVVCSTLVALGLFTRLAALGCAINMGVAFFMVHSMKLKGVGNGELALAYLAGFIAIFLAGAGKFSIDGGGGGKE